MRHYVLFYLMHAHKKAFIKRGWLLLYDQGRAFEDVLEICLFDRGKLIKLLFFTYYSPWTFCTWEVVWENNSLPGKANWQVGISCFLIFQQIRPKGQMWEKHTFGNTMWKGVCKWNPKLPILVRSHLPRNHSTSVEHTIQNTSSWWCHVSKEYETEIPRFPLGSSHP
jgi:hypothetical protein